jgi:hypothetical protein
MNDMIFPQNIASFRLQAKSHDVLFITLQIEMFKDIIKENLTMLPRA